jgi:molybdopterin/thiamine biosynthesis adenylyltransferase
MKAVSSFVRLGMNEARYHRNVMLFGEEGQRKLRQTKVVIAGVGGLGSPLAQHMALLGVEEVGLIDDEELDDTNRNRFIGARADDPVPGSPKVSLAARLIHETSAHASLQIRVGDSGFIRTDQGC